MEKILLDTDIGSDIDDAVCLAYLLMQPQCRLMGITTVMGETDQRSRLASAPVLRRRSGYSHLSRRPPRHPGPYPASARLPAQGAEGLGPPDGFSPGGMAGIHAGYHPAQSP